MWGIVASALVAALLAQPSEWRLTFRQTGGVAGVDRELHLTSGGELRVADNRARTQQSDRLPSDDLSRIESLLRELPSVGRPGSRPSSCRDCFLYDLQIVAGTETRSFHVDESSVGPSQLEPIVSALSRLLARTLTRQPLDQ